MENPLNDLAPMTLEAFLAWEKQQPGRHEFADRHRLCNVGRK